MNKLNNKDRGFTIIEVVLVLAIAALIMLMVFVAWPSLQRSQRDTARKNDVSSIVASISSYASNNGGSIPSNTAALSSYLGKLSRIDATKVTVSSSIASLDPTQASNLDTATVYSGAVCNGDAPKAGSARQMAVVTILEANGTPVRYCQDS